MTANSATLFLGEALETAQVICVLTHGRGQSPEAMVDQILQRVNAPRTAFVLPRAGSGSWYDAKAVDPLTEKTTAQLSTSLLQLRTITGDLPKKTPVVMAGFSQGACLSIEYAFKFGGWKGALVAFTGCRVGTSQDNLPRSSLANLPVYISGSDVDPWIPLSAFSRTVQELGAAQARVRADVFPQRGHEVTDTEVAMLERALHSFAEGRGAPW
jgi:phospholipase/carboxylesterase